MIIQPTFDSFCRYSDSHHIWFNIFGHNGSSSKPELFPISNSGEKTAFLSMFTFVPNCVAILFPKKPRIFFAKEDRWLIGNHCAVTLYNIKSILLFFVHILVNLRQHLDLQKLFNNDFYCFIWQILFAFS